MKINEIKLLTNNLSATEKFYTEILGLKILERSRSQISFAAGRSRLTFLVQGQEGGIYHFAFEIPHNQLVEAQQWLSHRVDLIGFQGSSVIDFPNWNAKSLYFYDTNGNVLEFIARFDNKTESYAPFTSSSLIRISEIALVSDDVDQLASDLIRVHGLQYFRRQEQSEEFSVLGHDDGLIILVKSTRNWFPTPVHVAKFPVQITIETDIEFDIDYR
jgi:catechol 2,3-dioxygenase-like lactoylglutathione lyase family enzyme